MEYEKILKVLEAHGIPFFITGKQIFADSMISGTGLFEQVEEITKMNKSQFMQWLGY